MKWDGSYIGEIVKSNIISNEHKIVYNVGTLICNEQCYRVLYHQTINNFPNVFDELTSVFGVKKCGTHSCIIGGKLFILYDANGLDKINEDIEISKNSAQEIYMFRMILGLRTNNFTSIAIKDQYPVSIRNNVTERLSEQTDIIHLPNKICEKYEFVSYSKIIRRMLKGRSLYDIRIEIDTIVKRLNKDMVHLPGDITSRIEKFI